MPEKPSIPSAEMHLQAQLMRLKLILTVNKEARGHMQVPSLAMMRVSARRAGAQRLTAAGRWGQMA